MPETLAKDEQRKRKLRPLLSHGKRASTRSESLAIRRLSDSARRLADAVGAVL
jgi:hypothetical protein